LPNIAPAYLKIKARKGSEKAVLNITGKYHTKKAQPGYLVLGGGTKRPSGLISEQADWTAKEIFGGQHTI